MEWDIEIDARDLVCPLPVLRLQQRLRDVTCGQIVRLLATDPVAEIDIPHFCAETGHTMLGATTLNGMTVYFIQKAGEEPAATAF